MSRNVPSLPPSRLSAPERREQLLDVAIGLFADHGLSGTTTIAVAKAGGVSQPYIMKMFGSKEQLITAVGELTIERISGTFRRTLAALPADADAEEVRTAMGVAYVELVVDRATLLSMAQFFSLGTDPVFGPMAREGFMSIYRILRQEAGFDAEEAVRFVQVGMLINTLASTRMFEHADDDPEIKEMVSLAFNHDADEIIGLLSGTVPGLTREVGAGRDPGEEAH